MSSLPAPPEPGSAPHQQLPSDDAYDSGIIETAEEVEVPELSLEPATARSDLPPPNVAPPAPFAPRPSASPSWSALAEEKPERSAGSWLPRSIAVARRYPVLWLVAAPVGLAGLLVLLASASGPGPRAETKPSAPALRPAAPPAAPSDPRPAAAPAITTLEARDPTSLSVDELLLLSSRRTQRQRADAKAFAQKLLAEPELIQRAAVQSELRSFAANPATASEALAAMAMARSPIGPDLLFEVWASRSSASVTAELARALLYSRDVRKSASPALAVALDLRSADSCQAVQAALPSARANGDTRAIAPLVKLSYRRGCGVAQREDCHPCLRSNPKELSAVINAANRRRAPSYPSARAK